MKIGGKGLSMAKGKILGTGLSGLVGSRVVELLQDRYTFENISLETGIDITDKASIGKRIGESDAEVVLHMAAKTDVDGCERDRPLGEKGEAFRVNVFGTEHIVELCKKTGKKIVYISTDFVFDGEKDGQYAEEDHPHPINWYGTTKYEGERIVQNATVPWIIARIAYPFRASFPKNDFIRSIAARLRNGEKLRMVEDHITTPTFIDDIAIALDTLIQRNETGMYHVVGSQSLTPYEAAFMLAEVFEYDQTLIGKTTREEYFKDRAPRPFNLSLKNDKIQKLGIRMKTFGQGIREVKKQMTP